MRFTVLPSRCTAASHQLRIMRAKSSAHHFAPCVPSLVRPTQLCSLSFIFSLFFLEGRKGSKSARKMYGETLAPLTITAQDYYTRTSPVIQTRHRRANTPHGTEQYIVEHRILPPTAVLCWFMYMSIFRNIIFYMSERVEMIRNSGGERRMTLPPR